MLTGGPKCRAAVIGNGLEPVLHYERKPIDPRQRLHLAARNVELGLIATASLHAVEPEVSELGTFGLADTVQGTHVKQLVSGQSQVAEWIAVTQAKLAEQLAHRCAPLMDAHILLARMMPPLEFGFSLLQDPMIRRLVGIGLEILMRGFIFACGHASWASSKNIARSAFSNSCCCA
jgi:hypothetical protein